MKVRGKGTEDKIIGKHHQLNWHEFEQAPGDGVVHGSLTFCSHAEWVGHD